MKHAALTSLGKCIVACVLMGSVGAAGAADPDATRYAIVSAIGDELSIVTYQSSTGSNLDTNLRKVLPLEDDAFDRLAAGAAANAIKRAVPGAQTQSTDAHDPSEFRVDEELLHSDSRLKSFLEPVRAQIAQPDIRYLVLISKFHGDARLKFERTNVGSGKLSGLGFYLDYQMRTYSSNTGERGRGFIAPYVYITVSLIDMASGALVRSESIAETTSLSAARSSTGTDPWDALSADRKVRMINGLINKAVQTLVPHVVAPT